jgi:hypothetical protein
LYETTKYQSKKVNVKESFGDKRILERRPKLKWDLQEENMKVWNG